MIFTTLFVQFYTIIIVGCLRFRCFFFFFFLPRSRSSSAYSLRFRILSAFKPSIRRSTSDWGGLFLLLRGSRGEYREGSSVSPLRYAALVFNSCSPHLKDFWLHLFWCALGCYRLWTAGQQGHRGVTASFPVACTGAQSVQIEKCPVQLEHYCQGEWVSEVAAVPIPVFRYSVLTSKYVEILERDAFEGMEPCDHCVVVAFEKPISRAAAAGDTPFLAAEFQKSVVKHSSPEEN